MAPLASEEVDTVEAQEDWSDGWISVAIVEVDAQEDCWRTGRGAAPAADPDG